MGSLIAGPLCARLLADFGADVIKIEPPGAGDPLRHWGTDNVNGRDLLWTIYARNKRCVTLDLRQDKGRDLAKQLIAKSNVVVENFRPGTMEKWGLGPQDLFAANPDLVMVRVSGFGQTGPYSQKAGFGSVGEAMGGIRYTTGYPDRASTRTGVSLGDSLAAMFGALGALASLQAIKSGARGEPGAVRGQVVDVAVYEAVYALMESLVPDYQLLGKVRERSGPVLPHVAPSNTYPCSDGVDVLIAANADNVFRRLCDVMEQPELATDPRFATHTARGENQDEIDGIVGQWTQQFDSRALVTLLDEAGVPAGPIYTARNMVDDPHFAARGMIQKMMLDEGLEFPMPGIVPNLSGTPGEVRWAGPLTLGSHNAEVFEGLLGLSAAERAALQEAGVI
ncbi:MAG: CoA transferase [Dehalococcoidia bacterium]|nr:CoA transferase [Dehalococcoidia bacterium]